MSTALVTGPTSGIGLAFARQLAADGYDLVLVSRDAQRLADVASEVEALGVSAEVLAADLSERAQLARVEERLRDPDRPIDLLVNNAGFSVNQRFVDGELAAEQRLLDVLVVAVMRLSHAALPSMVERGSGGIINVSSVAGFLPFGTYSAAKSWVIYFTQGLANELEGTGIRVVAACPGFVRTEFHDRAGIDMSRASSRIWVPVNEVVDQALLDLERGKVLSVAGTRYKVLTAASHLMPREGARRLERLRRRTLGR